MADEIVLPIRTRDEKPSPPIHGNFRLLNVATGKYLSAQRSSDALDTRPRVVGSLFDRDASNQICRVRVAPNDDTSKNGLDAIIPGEAGALVDVVPRERQYVIELLSSTSASAVNAPFRLEVSSDSLFDSVQEILIPGPTVLVPQASPNLGKLGLGPAVSTTAQASNFETGIPKTRFSEADANGVQVLFSSRGGPQTYYKLVQANKDEVETGFDEYYIVNLATNSYLCHGAIDPGIFSSNRDLTTDSNGGNAAPSRSDANFRWILQREHFGPAEGDYRIIHSKSLTSLTFKDSVEATDAEFEPPKNADDIVIQRLTNTTTSPAALSTDFKDAVWFVDRQIVDDSSFQEQIHQISLQGIPAQGLLAQSQTNVHRQFHLIHVPSTLGSEYKKTGILPIPPLGRPALSSSNLHYLIFERVEKTLTFWGLLPRNTTSTSVSSKWVLVTASIEAESPDIWKSSILRLLHQDTAMFWADYGWLIWRFNPARKYPEDGVYLIRQHVSSEQMTSRYLGVSSLFSDVGQLEMYTNTSPSQREATLWHIESNIASNGVIFQTVTNYYTGHACNVYMNGMSCFRASRESRWQRWHIVQKSVDLAAVAKSVECEWISHVEVDKLVNLNGESLSLIARSSLSPTWDFILYNFPSSRPAQLDIKAERPAWFKKDTTCKHDTPILQDGIYRILHQATRGIVTVDAGNTDIPGLKMTPVESQSINNYVNGFWYIKSTRSKKDPTFVEYYTIISLSQLPLHLKESNENIGLPFQGIRSTLGQANRSTGTLWFLWRIEQSNWVIQCVDGSKGYLKLDRDGLPGTFPLMAAEPLPSDMWGFVPYKQDISSGIYHSYSIGKKQYISCKSIPSSSKPEAAEFVSERSLSSKWIIKPANRYSYHVQHMQSMRYLQRGVTANGEDAASIYTTSEADKLLGWVFLPDSGGNVAWRCLEAELQNDKQQGEVWSLSRAESSPRLFDSKLSDKVAPGQFSIKHSPTGQYLSWKQPSDGGVSFATCSASNKETWQLAGTGTGFYTLTASQKWLGMPTLSFETSPGPPQAAIPGSDLSQWKFIQNNIGQYKIVNKETGLALGFKSEDENLSQMRDDAADGKLCTWDFEMITPALNDEVAKFSLVEKSFANGIYTFEKFESVERMTLTQSSGPVVVTKAGDISQQNWGVMQLSNGWYRIKHVVFDTHLAVDRTRGSKSSITLKNLQLEDDLSVTEADWRFIQASKDGCVHLINQMAPDQAVGVEDRKIILTSLDAAVAGSISRWNVRLSTDSRNSNLTPGVYMISRIPLTVSPQNSGEQAQIKALAGRAGVVELSALEAQRSSQLWFFESTDNASIYRITQFDRNESLQVENDRSQNPRRDRNWKIVPAPTGGYVITDNSGSMTDILGWDENDRVTIEVNTYDRELAFIWQIKKCGFHLQSLAQGFANQIVEGPPGVGDAVRLVPFVPRWTGKWSANEAQSRVWHLVKSDEEGSFRLVNQLTRQHLQPLRGAIMTADASRVENPKYASWKIGKIDDGLCLQWQAVPQLFLAVLGGSDGRLILRAANENPDDGTPYQAPVKPSMDLKSWQLVPIDTTEREFSELPQCILPCEDFDLEVPEDGNHVWAQSGNSFARVPYKMNSAAQRFRVQTLGKHMMFINEASKYALRCDGGVQREMTSQDLGSWFSIVDNKWPMPVPQDLDGVGIIDIASLTANTGDFHQPRKHLRLQVGNSKMEAQVVAVDSNGRVVAEDLDMSSKMQLWSLHQWSRGWYIIHVVSRKLLSITRDMQGVMLEESAKCTELTLWYMNLDVDHRHRDGFYDLCNARFRDYRLLVDDNRSIKMSNSTVSGFKLVRESSWLNLARRLKVLETFCRTRCPLFIFSNDAPKPCSVEEYLAMRSLKKKSSDVVVKSPVTVDDLPTDSDDYILVDNGTSKTNTPTAYVEIKSSADPVYLNYTEFVVSLISRSSKNSWTSITLRINNETNQLDSCHFPKEGWIMNVDSTFCSTDEVVANPLRIHRVNSLNLTKLHVFIGDDGLPTPFFADGVSLKDLEDESKWGLWWDSGSSYQITRASMVDSDATGVVDLTPAWMKYRASW